MFTLAWVFLADHPAFRTGLIIIGLARCIAMVLIWNDLACGDRERGRCSWPSTRSSRSSPTRCWALLPDDPARVARPRHAGRQVLDLGDHQGGADLPRHPAGRRLPHPPDRHPPPRRDWYEQQLPAPHRALALYGLLFTIVVMFALQGDAITADPLDVALIAVPLLVYFAIMWSARFVVGRRARLPIPEDRNPRLHRRREQLRARHRRRASACGASPPAKRSPASSARSSRSPPSSAWSTCRCGCADGSPGPNRAGPPTRRRPATHRAGGEHRRLVGREWRPPSRNPLQRRGRE